MNEVTIVIGGQYGSEGKGAYLGWQALEGDWSDGQPFLTIRTGGPQAGHSIIYHDHVYKMRQVPCTWPNPHAKLAIGPGALIDVELLERELYEIVTEMGDNLYDRLSIDPNAALVTPGHKRREEVSVGMNRIGSTKEGVGEAQADRVLRIGKRAIDITGPLERFIRPVDELVHEWHGMGNPIVIESTQGFLLSLTRSHFYPTVTSRDITPAQVLNDAGVPTTWKTDIDCVMRTYPIRVAGPSGPFGGAEISWADLSERTGGYVEEERTTVTNKVRRVAEWDDGEALQTIKHVQPSQVVLTFADYWWPELAKAKILPKEHADKIKELSQRLGTPINLVGTGFQHYARV